MPKRPDTVQIVIANIEYFKSLNNINNKELCTRAQIVPSTFSRKMHRISNRTFDIDELSRIARVLKVTVSELVSE